MNTSDDSLVQWTTGYDVWLQMFLLFESNGKYAILCDL